MNNHPLAGFNKAIDVKDVYKMYLINDLLKYVYGSNTVIPFGRCMRIVNGEGMRVVVDCYLEEQGKATYHAQVVGALRPDTLIVYDDGQRYNWRQYKSARIDHSDQPGQASTYKRGNRTPVVEHAIARHCFVVGYQVQWLNDTINPRTRMFQSELTHYLQNNRHGNFF